jgi:hypothetical protein
MTGPLKAIAVLALLASASLAAQQVATTAAERFTRLDVNHDGALSKYEVDAESSSPASTPTATR